MGLLYTKLYLDFDPGHWEESATDPVTFRARADGAVLDIDDTSHKAHRLVFRKGGTVSVMRVTGKFRVRWGEDSILSA